MEGSEGKTITGAPFEIKDCALITLATGLRARTLRELSDRIEHCPLASIEYHFYSSQLRPTFDDPEYHNDFALWARHALHDHRLAERLGVLDPLQYRDLEALRQHLLDVVQDRLSESESIIAAGPEHEFIFLRAQTVIFDTGHRATSVADLARLVPQLPTGSVYYHFVEARRRLPGGADDFSAWLVNSQDGCEPLCDLLRGVDYYFSSLTELRARLAAIFADWIAREASAVS